MHEAYTKTRFLHHEPVAAWPAEFVIVTAYATTGEQWSAERNAKSNRELQSVIQELGCWHTPVTGYDPGTEHAEPGWAIELSFDQGCDLGLRFLQDAIYHVRDDSLSVSYCDKRRSLVALGRFSERLSDANEDAKSLSD